MNWKRKKVYGESKITSCAFCGKMATQKTEAGLEVCYQHTKSIMEEIKCTCGSWLEQRSGKFGAYFNCFHCGNINFQKAMEMKALQIKEKPKVEQLKPALVKPALTQENDHSTAKDRSKKASYSKEPTETTIDTNDVEYFS